MKTLQQRQRQRTPRLVPALSENDAVDDLHKQLVVAEIGVASPLMFLRGTDKPFCMVVPRELPPLTVRNRERARQ